MNATRRKHGTIRRRSELPRSAARDDDDALYEGSWHIFEFQANAIIGSIDHCLHAFFVMSDDAADERVVLAVVAVVLWLGFMSCARDGVVAVGVQIECKKCSTCALKHQSHHDDPTENECLIR